MGRYEKPLEFGSLAETMSIIGLRKLTSTIPTITDAIITSSLSGGIISGLISVGSESTESQLNQVSEGLKSAIEDLRTSLLGKETEVTVDQWERIKKKLPERFGIYISRKSISELKKHVDPKKYFK